MAALAEELIAPVVNPIVDGAFQCPLCECSCSRKSYLVKHLNVSHKGISAADARLVPLDLVSCSLCPTLCCSALGVQQHFSRTHRGQAAVAQPVEIPGQLEAATVAIGPEIAPEVNPNESWSDFISLFQLPLAFVHWSWRPLIRRIITRLIGKFCREGSANVPAMLQDLAAFLILPGLIKLKYLKQLSQGKNLRVIDFLRDVDNAFDAGAKIIEVARGYAAGQRLRRETPSPDTVIPGLARRAKQLVKEQRYSAACELVDRIQSRLDDPAANLNPMPLAMYRACIHLLTIVTLFLSGVRTKLQTAYKSAVPKWSSLLKICASLPLLVLRDGPIGRYHRSCCSILEPKWILNTMHA